MTNTVLQTRVINGATMLMSLTHAWSQFFPECTAACIFHMWEGSTNQYLTQHQHGVQDLAKTTDFLCSLATLLHRITAKVTKTREANLRHGTGTRTGLVWSNAGRDRASWDQQLCGADWLTYLEPTVLKCSPSDFRTQTRTLWSVSLSPITERLSVWFIYRLIY